jgi:hypothetical protein
MIKCAKTILMATDFSFNPTFGMAAEFIME